MAGYESRAALISDPLFIGRLNACTSNEAVGMSGDFSDRILSGWGYGGQIFGPLVVSLPGFDRANDEITDGDILAGVQASWARAEAITMGGAP